MIVFSVILLYFMFLHFIFILWAVVSAAYSALLSSSYFERINDDEKMMMIFRYNILTVKLQSVIREMRMMMTMMLL